MYERFISSISSQVFISLYVLGDCFSSWGAGLLLDLVKVSSVLEAFLLLPVLGWSGDVIASISFNDVIFVLTVRFADSGFLCQESQTYLWKGMNNKNPGTAGIHLPCQPLFFIEKLREQAWHLFCNEIFMTVCNLNF